MTFLCFSSNEIGLLWSFISRSSSFSVIQTLILSRKKEWAFVVVFIFKRPGSYAIYRRNARVLEMQNFIPAYMTNPVRTNLVPRVFSLSNMAAAGEKTLAHSELKRSLIGSFHSAFILALSLVYSFLRSAFFSV